MNIFNNLGKNLYFKIWEETYVWGDFNNYLNAPEVVPPPLKPPLVLFLLSEFELSTGFVLELALPFSIPF